MTRNFKIRLRFILLLVLCDFAGLFLLECCDQNTNQSEESNETYRQDHFTKNNNNYQNTSQNKKIIKPPEIVDTDTCPKPKTIIIPRKAGGSFIILSNKGPIKMDLKPPVNISMPIVSRNIANGIPATSQYIAGMGAFINYNTDNGLALDGVSSSIVDKMGNLWFGTLGGGVSRYDGKIFTNFTTDQGLGNNLVWDIAEDKNGNLWFATYGGGISCYNGYSFISYTTKQGLANNNVVSIKEDKKGNLWFGTDGGGISCFNGRTFINYSTSDGLGKNNVWSILEDKKGNLWFGTYGGGVSIFDGHVFKNFTISQGLANNTVVSIFEDKKGNIWLGTEGGGLSCYDGKSFKTYDVSMGLANNNVWSIAEDKRGNLWFGTDGGGVSCYDGITFSNYSTFQGLSNNIVLSISEDKNGNLWFATYGGGVSCYNNNSFISFSTKHGLTNNLVKSIAEDNKGNLWFGTDGGGLSCYNGTSFINYTTSQGLANSIVKSIAEDDSGNLWFGTSGGGVSYFNGKSFTNYTTAQGLIDNNIWSILEDRNGNIWFATGKGASCFDGRYFTNYSIEQGLPNNIIKCIAEDKSGNLWFGTEGGGVSFYDFSSISEGRLFTNFNTCQGLSNDKIWCITSDNEGNLWFGTDGGGVCILTKEVQEKIKQSKSNKSINISNKNADSFKPKEDVALPYFKTITKNEGLPDNMVTQILQDNKGRIFAGTNYGICEIITKISGEYTVGSVYYTKNGYPIKDVNSGQNAMFKDSKGIIWAATGADKTALVRFDPESINKSEQPPIVLLQSVKINNEKICWNILYDSIDKPMMNSSLENTSSINMNQNQDSLVVLNEELLIFGKQLSKKERFEMLQKFSGITFDSIGKFFPIPINLVLPYFHNNVTFEYNAIEPSRHNLILYQYKLEGYDKEWSPVTDKTSANFGNIYEGTYTFMLRACNPDGIWSDPITYTFKVLPPWWRTWWMYSIYIILAVGTLYIVYHWRVASLKKRQKELEQTVKERTAEISEKNKELHQQNEEITTQRDEIEVQKNIIESKNRNITDSIHYARFIQQAILPSEEKLNELLHDYFILYKPKDIVSGDFYWVEVVNEAALNAGEKGNIVLFAAVDCTGHGVPGAFMSLLGYNSLMQAVNENNINKPAEILNFLSKYILKTLRKNSAERNVKDGMDLCLCSLNRQDMILEYAGVHNSGYLIRQGEVISMKPDSHPIGEGFNEEFSGYANNKISLKKGDTIYLFTDGYIDQFGGPKRKKFMSKKFKELLIEIQNLKMEDQKLKLDEIFESYRDDIQQNDDVLVIGIRI